MTHQGATSRPGTEHDLFKGMATKKKKTRKAETAPAIQVGEHGRYQIKSGRLSGEYVARAFPKPPTKVRGLIAEATGATEAAAIAALHDLIDARENQRTSERRKDSRFDVPVPSTDEYVEAIGQVALSKPQLAMLTALSLAGEDGLTDAEMTSLAGYRSRPSARRSFAAAGLLIADYLSIEARPGNASGDPEGTFILGYRGETHGDAEAGTWIMHEELRDAVRLCT